MGTDITVFVEKELKNGQWELFDEPLVHNEPYNYPETPVIPQSIYHGRNYGLFAILSGCRNGHRAEELFEIIDDPRGVPDDMSKLARKVYSPEGYHNATWFFVEEIFDFDWSKTIQRVGFIDQKYAKLFKGNPKSYPAEELRRLQNPNAKPGEATFTTGPSAYSIKGTKVRWRETYREVAENFLNALEPYRTPGRPLSGENHCFQKPRGPRLRV